jgi:hypothetical protein
MLKEAVVAYFSNAFGSEGLEKTTMNLSQYHMCPGFDWRKVSPGYNSETLRPEQAFSLFLITL